MTKKQGTESGCFSDRFPLASGDGDLYHPDKRGCKGPVYRILCGKRKVRSMRFWWGSSRCIPITARLRSTGKAALQLIRFRQINQRPKAIKYLLKEAQKTQDPSLFIIEMRMLSMPDEEWRIR